MARIIRLTIVDYSGTKECEVRVDANQTASRLIDRLIERGFLEPLPPGGGQYYQLYVGGETSGVEISPDRTLAQQGLGNDDVLYLSIEPQKPPDKVTRTTHWRIVTQRFWDKISGQYGVAVGLFIILLVVPGLGWWYIRTMSIAQAKAELYASCISYISQESWALAKEKCSELYEWDPEYKDIADRCSDVQKKLDLQDWFSKGQDALAKGNLAEAVSNFEKVLGEDPGYDDIVDKLFAAYRDNGKQLADAGALDDALDQFQRALQLKPKDQEVTIEKDLVEAYLEGVKAFEKGSWEEATDSLEKVFQTRPEFHETRERLAMAYLNLTRPNIESEQIEQLEKARVQLERAQVVIGPRPPTSLTRILEQTATVAAEVNDKLYQAYVEQCEQLVASGKCADAREGQNWASKALTIVQDGSEAKSCSKQAGGLCEPRLVLVAQGSRDFSGTQGAKGWYYLTQYYRSAAGGQQLPFWDGDRGRWYTSPDWVRMDETGGHPDYYYDVIRQWRSSVSGKVLIYCDAHKVDCGGDGVILYVRLNGELLWSSYLSGCNTTGATNFFIGEYAIKAGDRLDFGIGSYGDTTYDHTVFDPIIKQWFQPE